MKKIYLGLIALAVGISTQAQRKLALECEVVNPTYNQNITTGSTVTFQYKIFNNSATVADSLQAGDTIKIFDPASKFVSGTGFTTYSGNIVLSTSIPKGGTLTVSSSSGLAFASILSLADPADTLKVKSAPFTNNKQYAWFVSIFDITVPSTNIAIDPTSTASSDTGMIWINKSTGIAEASASSNDFITTYPNPAVNELSFNYTFSGNQKATTRILDVAGRTVFAKEFEQLSGDQKFNLDIANLQNGVYLLHVIVGDKTMINRFTVQK